MIRPVSPGDAAIICDIYNYYIENSIASFEETPVRAAEMEERIRKITAMYPYLVLEEAGGAGVSEINGYAYINKWRERSAYRFAAEVSIYVRDGFQSRGMGRKLMEKLLEEVRRTNIHTLVAGIVLPNHRSVALFEKFGFKKIGQFSEIGYKFDRWHDVAYWELRLP